MVATCVAEAFGFLGTPLFFVLLLFLYFYYARRRVVDQGGGSPEEHLCCGCACFGPPALSVDDEWYFANFLPQSWKGYLPCAEPQESFGTWWRHGHEYVSPWHPWRNTTLSKEKRVVVLLITASFSLLMNTGWQREFPSGGLNLGGFFGVLSTVTIVRWIVVAALPYSMEHFEAQDGFRGWRSSAMLKKQRFAATMQYLSVIFLIGLFVAVCFGMFSLAMSENCESLLKNVLWGFLLTEVVYAIPITFLQLYIVYYVLSKKGQHDSHAAPLAYDRMPDQETSRV